MEPPPSAYFDHGVWHCTVVDPWRKELVLARSDYVRDYGLCVGGRCRSMAHWIPVSAGTTVLSAFRVQP